jgi:hypothetical protein
MRLAQQITLTADPILIDLQKELDGYSNRPKHRVAAPTDVAAVVVPLRLRLGEAILSFFSTTMVFGTPVDITLSELALESFFPVDAATAAKVRELAPPIA